MNRRKRILINKPFQFKIALFICTWIIALSFAYPLITVNIFDRFVEYLALDPNGPSISTLVEQRGIFLQWLYIFELIFLGLAFFISIFTAHRIAGPIHQLSQSLQRMRQGDFSTPIHFRKKDYFQELEIVGNDLRETLHARFSLKNEQIQSAQKTLESLSLKVKDQKEFYDELQKILLALENAAHN
jgi:methyl-accepting chemotaxis protein